MKIPHIKKQFTAYFNIVNSHYSRLPQNNRRALTIIVPIFIVALLLPVSDPVDESNTPRTQIEISNQETAPSAQSAKTATPKSQTPTTTTKWQRYQIKKGDSLIKIFRASHIPDTDLYAVAAIEGKGKPVSRIHPGQWIQYKQLKDGSLDALLIEMDKGEPIMYFRLSSGDFIRDE